jgi:hypothetical protein
MIHFAKHKPSSKKAFVLFFLIGLAVAACAPKYEKFPAGQAIRGDVLTFDSSTISNPSDIPKFRYGPQTFAEMNNVENLSGPRFRMLLGGDLRIQESIGTVITNSEFTGYTIPRLDYRTIDGVVKPLNSKSLAMLSAGYQFDALINKVQDLTGKQPSDFFQGYEQFSIIFHPSIEISDSGEQTRKYENSNAAYVAGAKQFALFSLGNSERVPMSFNPQVLAHEFGHAIFERSFFANKYERCTPGQEYVDRLFKGRLETEFIIRGINEGFADFVSFVWTGSANILQSSVGDSLATRERDFSKFALDYETYSTKESLACQGRFYCIGTLWAKTLFEVFNARGLDAKNIQSRQTFLREVVSLKEKVGNLLRENEGDRLPDVDDSVRNCLSRDSLRPFNDGDLLAAFFESLIESAEPNLRQSYCAAIIKNFGASGFPISARGGCP